MDDYEAMIMVMISLVKVMAQDIKILFNVH